MPGQDSRFREGHKKGIAARIEARARPHARARALNVPGRKNKLPYEVISRLLPPQCIRCDRLRCATGKHKSILHCRYSAQCSMPRTCPKGQSHTPPLPGPICRGGRCLPLCKLRSPSVPPLPPSEYRKQQSRRLTGHLSLPRLLRTRGPGSDCSDKDRSRPIPPPSRRAPASNACKRPNQQPIGSRAGAAHALQVTDDAIK